MRWRLFLHYEWFLQKLEKGFIPVDMHTTVPFLKKTIISVQFQNCINSVLYVGHDTWTQWLQLSYGEQRGVVNNNVAAKVDPKIHRGVGISKILVDKICPPPLSDPLIGIGLIYLSKIGEEQTPQSLNVPVALNYSHSTLQQSSHLYSACCIVQYWAGQGLHCCINIRLLFAPEKSVLASYFT